MAELPRYQQTGLLPADTTRLDFANIKESIGMSKGIQSSLDRISNFAFKEAGEKAQREGMQYGAENRPSVEQVTLAMEQGKSIEDLLAKPGTAFGDAARKIQAGQLRLELEAKARQDALNLDAQYQTGKITYEQLNTSIKALSDGFSRVLASADPEESLRFRASFNTASNAIFTKASETQVKLFTEGLKTLAKDSLSTTDRIVATTFEAEQDPEMILQRTRVERARVYDIAVGTRDVQFTQQTMKEFDQKVITAMVDYISKPEISKNSAEVFARLQSGDLGKLSKLYSTMDKKEVIAGYMKNLTDKRQILDAQRSVEKLQNEDMANSLLIEYFNPNTSQVRKRDIGVQLARSKVLSIDQMERFLNPDIKDGDPYAFADMKYKVATGVITDLDELRSATIKSGFSGKQYSALAETLISRTKSDETKAYKMASQHSGFGDVRPGKTKNNEHQFKKEQKILEYYAEVKQATIMDRGTFNPQDAMLIAIERYDNNDRKNVQKADAKAKLDNISGEIRKRKKLKTDFIIDAETNLDDLLNSKIISNDEYVQLNKLQKTLRQEAQ